MYVYHIQIWYWGGNTPIVIVRKDEEETASLHGNTASPCRNNEGGCPTLTTKHEQPILAEDNEALSVRRIMPVEAERLQGFPDGWTDIGQWTDGKGKLRDSTDSARFRVLGNSIAVGYANRQRGFWMWVMKRISAQYERSATLGSLFDGIGGFPLAWEFYNGKGSAIWASEIDEFCVAVTKKHFPEGEEIDTD